MHAPLTIDRYGLKYTLFCGNMTFGCNNAGYHKKIRTNLGEMDVSGIIPSRQNSELPSNFGESDAGFFPVFFM